MNKKVTVTINRGEGQLETLILPVISETTTGYNCAKQDTFGAPKFEWFPRHSKMVNCKEV